MLCSYNEQSGISHKLVSFCTTFTLISKSLKSVFTSHVLLLLFSTACFYHFIQLNWNQRARLFSCKIIFLSFLRSISLFATIATYEVCHSFSYKPLLQGLTAWQLELSLGWKLSYKISAQGHNFFFSFSKLKQQFKYVFKSGYLSSRITMKSYKTKYTFKRNPSFCRLWHFKQLTNYI